MGVVVRVLDVGQHLASPTLRPCSPHCLLLETSPPALHVAIPWLLSASSLTAPRQGAAPCSQHPVRTSGPPALPPKHWPEPQPTGDTDLNPSPGGPGSGVV